MHELREVIVGRVELTTVITTAEFMVPLALAAFHRKHPEASVKMRVFNSSQVEERALRNQADLGITLSHMHASSFTVEPFATDELVEWWAVVIHGQADEQSAAPVIGAALPSEYFASSSVWKAVLTESTKLSGTSAFRTASEPDPPRDAKGRTASLPKLVKLPL